MPQAPVVIVALCLLKLIKGHRNIAPDFFEYSKIHGCSRNRPHLSGGNGIGGGRRKEIGLDLNLMGQDTALFMAGQVEVSVIGQIERRILIRNGPIGKKEHGVFCQRIRDRQLKISRESLITVRAFQKEPYAVFFRQLLCLPEPPVIIIGSAVQVVGSVIFFQNIVLSMKAKTCAACSVGNPPHNGAKVGPVYQVLFPAVIA